MSRCGHPEQGFNMSMGVINLAKKFGDSRLELACKRANEYGAFAYSKVRNILDKNLEKETEDTAEQALPDHENIRGQRYYH
jgi:transposase